MYQFQFMQQPLTEKLLCASSGVVAKIKNVRFHLMTFMRESHTYQATRKIRLFKCYSKNKNKVLWFHGRKSKFFPGKVKLKGQQLLRVKEQKYWSSKQKKKKKSQYEEMETLKAQIVFNSTYFGRAMAESVKGLEREMR